MPLVKQYRGWIETQSAVAVGMKGTRSETTLGIRAAGSWACPATGSARLTPRLVSRRGPGQHPRIPAPNMVSFKGGRSQPLSRIG